MYTDPSMWRSAQSYYCSKAIIILLLLTLSTLSQYYIHNQFKMDPQEALKRFLLAKVYQEATEQTLSESDWELRKITSFLKSAFFEGEGKACMTSVEEVCV